MKNFFHTKTAHWLVIYILIALTASVSFAEKPEWKREKVDLRLSGGTRIKGIRYPKGKPVPTRARKKTSPIEATAQQKTATAVVSSIIDTPPVDGFIPWITVVTTNKRIHEDDMDWVTYPESSIPIVPGYTGGDPEQDPNSYAIGLFDTGASTSIMGFHTANDLNLYDGGYITSNFIEVSGVTGGIDVAVSHPLGIFIDSLGAINPDKTLDVSNMVGESNTSIIVGTDPGTERPDLPTAIGSPMAVFYTATFDNENPVTRVRNSNSYTAPDIHLYSDPNDPAIPKYPNKLPLELRPLSALNVQYIPSLDLFGALGQIEDFNLNFDFSTPGSPSVIMGTGSQSVFFVHSVDLHHGSKIASDKNRFMLDTGAQVTVIGNRIGARLGLDHNNPDFYVEIMGVTSGSEDMPGFYIDKIQMPALGQWLEFTNVPVVLLDIASPEGGTLDGIIGMNLFVKYNFVLRGGGLFLDDDPTLEFEQFDLSCSQVGDIAPAGGDCIVNSLDLIELANQWLETSGTANIAPLPDPDDIVNLLDFALIAKYWMKPQ
jgi:hypothetical protein